MKQRIPGNINAALDCAKNAEAQADGYGARLALHLGVAVVLALLEIAAAVRAAGGGARGRS